MAKRRKNKPNRKKSNRKNYRKRAPGTSIFTKVFAVVLGASFFFLGAAVSYILIGPILVNSWDNNDYGVFVGSSLIIALAIAGVRASRFGLMKSLPFHLIGVLAFFFLGRYISFFESLQILGGVIYLGVWVWAYLIDTIITSFTKRTQETS